MSFNALKWAFEMDFPKMEGISMASAKITFLALCNFAGENGEAFPTWETLSRVTCLDRKSVSKSLKALCGSGLIQDTGKKTGKFSRVSVYKVMQPEQNDSTKYGPIEDVDSTKYGTIEQNDSTKSGMIEGLDSTKFAQIDSTKFGTHNQSYITDKEHTPPPHKREPVRPHRLPDDWTPNERCLKVIRDRGIDYDLLMAEFFTYWHGPKAVGGGLKVNWDATFLNHIKRFEPAKYSQKPKQEKRAPLNART